MLFPNNREALRRYYFDAWHKYRTGMPLTPLEDQIVGAVLAHPEYHPALEKPDHTVDKDYLPGIGDANPFLHLGLHLGLQEQIATDRPAGLRAIHAQLLLRYGDPHATEHAMMECLADILWQAQRNARPPDEHLYLQRLRELAP